MTASSKLCPSCAKTKALSEFHKDRSRRDGLHAVCKECNKAKVAAWQKANPQRASEARRKYRTKNQARLYAAQVAWRKANPDKVQASNQRRRVKGQQL